MEMEGMVPSWSSFLWRGFASAVFGVVALAWPRATLEAVTLLFGAYAFADGILALVVAVRRGKSRHRWLLVLDGILGVGAGLATLLSPGLTLLALVYVIGARAIVMGGLQVGAARALRRSIRSPVLYALGGVASIVFGFLTFLVPGVSAFVLVTMLGAYSLVFGVLLVVLAFTMRRPVDDVSTSAMAT